MVADVDGRPLGRAVVDAAPASPLRPSVPALALTFTVDVPAGEAVQVDLRSRSWVPAALGIGTDTRPLGVPVIGVHARRLAGQVARAAPVLAGHTGEPAYLDSYDRILANSHYTQRWIERLWHRDSDVLHPPVTLVPPGDKERVILSVGRFFVPGTGHNEAAGDGGGVPPAGGGRERRGLGVPPGGRVRTRAPALPRRDRSAAEACR